MQRNRLTRGTICALLGAALALVLSCRSTEVATRSAGTFSSPEAAGDTLVAALKAGDKQALTEMMDGDFEFLLASGDSVADQRQRERFVTAYDLQHAWTSAGEGRAVLETGADGWPFPIPLVEGEGGWRFDVEQGADEILNRRIGRNELDAIQACLAFVDAEREYYQRNPRGLAKPEYARFILSSKGAKDGLYWETSGDETPSPLGSLYAAARSQGYAPTRGAGKPFHGYLYRVLHAQGASAPGGVYDYIRGGEMTRGFALVAWPAKHGVSGVMTFLVNHVGVLYQKDLGPTTGKIAETLAVFDPDESWAVVPAEAQSLPGT